MKNFSYMTQNKDLSFPAPHPQILEGISRKMSFDIFSFIKGKISTYCVLTKQLG